MPSARYTTRIPKGNKLYIGYIAPYSLNLSSPLVGGVSYNASSLELRQFLRAVNEKYFEENDKLKHVNDGQCGIEPDLRKVMSHRLLHCRVYDALEFAQYASNSSSLTLSEDSDDDSDDSDTTFSLAGGDTMPRGHPLTPFEEGEKLLLDLIGYALYKDWSDAPIPNSPILLPTLFIKPAFIEYIACVVLWKIRQHPNWAAHATKRVLGYIKHILPRRRILYGAIRHFQRGYRLRSNGRRICKKGKKAKRGAIIEYNTHGDVLDEAFPGSCTIVESDRDTLSHSAETSHAHHGTKRVIDNVNADTVSFGLLNLELHDEGVSECSVGS